MKIFAHWLINMTLGIIFVAMCLLIAQQRWTIIELQQEQASTLAYFGQIVDAQAEDRQMLAEDLAAADTYGTCDGVVLYDEQWVSGIRVLFGDDIIVLRKN